MEDNFKNDKDNLRKYWVYRKRLNDYFLFLSDNDDYGSNIPVDRITKHFKRKDGEVIIDEKIDRLTWDDSNGALPHYIMLLATEYKLLIKFSDSNNDNIKTAQNTLNDLKNAIKAVKRLERYADGIENGIFKRTDILYVEKRTNDEKLGEWQPVFDHYDNVNKGKVNLRFSELLKENNKPRYNSIDNIIKFIETESIVRKMLSNEGDEAEKISKMLYESVKNMITSVYHPNEPRKMFNRNKIAKHKGLMQRTWYLKDIDKVHLSPNNLIPEPNGGGADVYTYATSYGLSESAKKFNLKYKSTSFARIFFKFLMNIKTKTFTSNSLWMIRSLVSSNTFYKNAYKYLKNSENKYAKKLEQYPLFWAVLNTTKHISDNDRYEIYDLLNIAPENGPRNLLYTDENKKKHYIYDVYEWSNPNRFVWSELNGTGGINENGWKRHGYFNGIDYMLLHNLYWLTKNDEKNDEKIYKKINITDKIELR